MLIIEGPLATKVYSMHSGGDAGEPVLPLSSSGVMRATAAAAASTEQDMPPPIPPADGPSPNATSSSETKFAHSVSEVVPGARASFRESASKKMKRSKSRLDAELKFTKAQTESVKATAGSDKTKPGTDSKDIDVEIASPTSGLSRPSSRASQASEFSGLGGDSDLMKQFQMMKLKLKEKEKELQRMKSEQVQAEPASPSRFPQIFGKKGSEPKPEEEEVLLEPPDPAVILKEVRRRRFAVLVIIFVGMCTLPILLVQSFRKEITP